MALQTTAQVPAEFTASAYNASGSTIAKSIFVKRSGAVAKNAILPAAADDPIWGLTLESIANLTYGGIQTAGKGVATSSAAVTPGARVQVNTAGKCADWSQVAGTNAAVVGIALTGTTGADELFEIQLLLPGASRQG